MGASEVARAWFQRVWQQREVEAITELCAPGAVGHLRTCDIVGPAAFIQLWEGFFATFPDMQMSIDDVIGEGSKAVVRWRVRGTHLGDGLGFPPTGQKVDFTGLTMIEVRDGQIVEGWDEWDYGRLIGKLKGEPIT